MFVRPTSRYLLICMALAGATTLAGCGAVVVGGTAATAAAVATDRRTAGEQVEDQTIEMKVSAEMRRHFGETGRVKPTAYAGWVLLTGDVASEQDKTKAGQLASQIEKVTRVFNEVRVGDITPVSVRSNDTWITSKVKASLLNTKEVPSRSINVTTERGVVYLMGRVTEIESRRASKVAASVAGVNKVVTLFQVVSPENPSLAPYTAPAPVEPTPPATVTTESGVQVLPVQ